MYATVIKGGKADSKDELKVSRITTVCLGIVAVILLDAIFAVVLQKLQL